VVNYFVVFEYFYIFE